jgi:hypothetical protein
MELLVQFSPASCYVLMLRPKYSESAHKNYEKKIAMNPEVRVALKYEGEHAPRLAIVKDRCPKET